jgi:hypothetical protein
VKIFKILGLKNRATGGSIGENTVFQSATMKLFLLQKILTTKRVTSFIFFLLQNIQFSSFSNQ